MNITPLEISLRDLADGFRELPDGGAVSSMDGRLNIRPEYQRESCFSDAQQALVVDSVLHGYPIGVMYFAPTPEGGYEVLDGQQRILALCRFRRGAFSVPWGQGSESRDCDYANLPAETRLGFDDYRVRVFVCDGSDEEKMAWFRRINVAGMVLTDQELRNATFHGPFTSDARRMFSKPSAPALRHFGPFLTGVPLRQDYLQTALLWWARSQNPPEGLDDARLIDWVQSSHRMDPDAAPLFAYMRGVFNWVERTFPRHYAGKDKTMRGVDWGALYERFHASPLDPAALEAQADRLLLDDDVTNPRGVWPYVLDDDERHLNLRAFDKRVKRDVYREQSRLAALAGVSNCPDCAESDGPNHDRVYALNEMEADHRIPWSKGGRTTPDNCQLLCKRHNRIKSNQ